MYIEREAGSNYQTIIDYFTSHAKQNGAMVFLLHGMPFSGKTEMAKVVKAEVEKKDLAKTRWLMGLQKDLFRKILVEKIEQRTPTPASEKKKIAEGAERKPTLLILDALPEPSVLHAFIQYFQNRKAWILVVSRNPFLKEKVFTEKNRLWVDRFTDSEAQTLLRRILPDETLYPDGGLAKMNQVLGGNPGLLTVIGQAAARENEDDLETLLKQLRYGQKRAVFGATPRIKRSGETGMPNTIETVYAAWYERLSDLAKKILAHLAFFEHEKLIDPHLFVKIFEDDYSRGKVDAAFRELSQEGLMQPVKDGFMLPILTADYALRIVEDNKIAIINRLAMGFLKDIGPVDSKNFMKQCEPLYPHLQKLAKTADAQGRKIKPTLREALWNHLIAYEHGKEDWTSLLQSLYNRQILIEARKPGIEKTRARMDGLCDIIEAHESNGSDNDVIEGLNSLEEECETLVPAAHKRTARKELRQIVAEKRAWMDQKWIAVQSRPTNADEEREAFTRREKANARTMNPQLSPGERMQKADICMRQGLEREKEEHYLLAQERYIEAEHIVERILSPTHAFYRRILWKIGLTYLRRKQYRQASEVFERLYKGCKEGRERTDCLNYLGLAYLGFGRKRRWLALLGFGYLSRRAYNSALVQFEAAEEEEEARKTPSTETLIFTLLNQAVAYLMNGEISEAQNHLKQAKQRASEFPVKLPTGTRDRIDNWVKRMNDYDIVDRKGRKEIRKAINISNLFKGYLKKSGQGYQDWVQED